MSKFLALAALVSTGSLVRTGSLLAGELAARLLELILAPTREFLGWRRTLSTFGWT